MDLTVPLPRAVLSVCPDSVSTMQLGPPRRKSVVCLLLLGRVSSTGQSPCDARLLSPQSLFLSSFPLFSQYPISCPQARSRLMVGLMYTAVYAGGG
ncbi:hypothetical protein BD310DRAFT_930867 [Dichomitus squalens]|uniref:Uncharacterized protein n=1 Tax=Dichomitus squalens TaxID=114155 RepID=A0A4Q9PQQ0_9APHY|nr:hypothetical protein BD310DRAFT_930867 [Dichomitus squalens]